jgi:hypothetical protein
MKQEKKDKKDYNFVHSLYLSFYSKSFYQNVARNGKGFRFSYLLFLLCMVWIPEVSHMHSELSEYLSAEAPKYVQQVPLITISQGKVSMKEQAPYVIKNPEKGTPFAIIDPSGQTSSLDETSAVILLTQNRLVIKKGVSQSQTFDLKGIEHLTIDQKVIDGWIATFNTVFPVIVFPFILLYAFLFLVLQVLLSAGIGNLFAKRFQTYLTYKTLIRLSAVSFTPAIILQAFHALLNVPFPYSVPISFLISLGYLYYAVGSNSETTPSRMS